MNLENILWLGAEVVSLELGMRLKEAGILQEAKQSWWVSEDWTFVASEKELPDKDVKDPVLLCSAFTSVELYQQIIILVKNPRSVNTSEEKPDDLAWELIIELLRSQ